MSDFQIMTVEELAGMLRVDDRTLYRKCENGEIPFFRVGTNGAIRFDRETILNWIKEQQKQSYQGN